MSATLFCLLRHGETEWNSQKRIQGQMESELTATGQEQADSWGRGLRGWSLDRIISSDLGRAVHTARLCNAHLGLPHQREPRFREQHWGTWQGCVIRDLRTTHAEELAKLEKLGWNFRPPNGEDRNEVLHRTREALLEAAKNFPGQRILIVTHRGVQRTLDYGLSNCDYMPGSQESTQRGRLLLVQALDNQLRLLDRDVPLDAADKIEAYGKNSFSGGRSFRE